MQTWRFIRGLQHQANDVAGHELALLDVALGFFGAMDCDTSARQG